MALFLAYHPLQRHVGHKMLGCVALFGVATIVFGLSRHFFLSMIALAVSGAADMVSVVVRGTLVNLRTPSNMRGRVNAVTLLFVTSSNELGEFESGLVASWIGTVPAVVVGGIGTCAIVFLWLKIFPELSHADRFESAS